MAEGVPPHRAGELGDAIGPRERDELHAFVVDRRRQRQDQPEDVPLARVSLDRGEQANRRDRDRFAPDLEPRRVAQDRRGADHRVVILKRLALALEDDSADRTGGSRIALDLEDLLHHLPRLEIPFEAEAPGLAEGAAEPATRLRRNAHRIARLQERDADRLERYAVVRAEEVLDEAVERAFAPVDAVQTFRAAALADLVEQRARDARQSVQVVAAFSGHAADHAPGDRRFDREIGPERGQRARSLTTQVDDRHGAAW